MDTSKLKEGMVVKSYKAMCEVIGEEQLSRNSKQNQLHEWRKYFKWHNSGYQFIIDKIYIEPKEEIEMNESKNTYEINTDNLEVGIVIKNYKEMCKILKAEEKGTGNSRNSQMKDWERYFKWRKEGHKFIIEDIYNKPKEKIDGKIFGNNTIYANNIQDLILILLAKNPSEKINWSCNRLLKELSMVNNHYAICRKEIPNLSKTLDMKENYIYDFYNTAHSSLRTKLETALNILKRQSLIYWITPLMVYKEYIEIVMNKTGEPKIVNGQVVYKKKEVYEKANEEEIKLIMRLEEDVLEEILHKDGKQKDILSHKEKEEKQRSDKQTIFLQGKWNLFTKTVNEQLAEMTKIKYYYYSYEIIYNYDRILKALKTVLATEDDIRNELNNKIQECLRNGVENRHKNTMVKYATREIIEGDEKEKGNDQNIKTKPTYPYDRLKMQFDYITNNNQLIDELIDIHKKKGRMVNK